MEKGGDLPISCGLWCFPGKMEQSEEYHNPDPTSSRGEKPEAGKAALPYKSSHWWETRGRPVGIFGAASLNLVWPAWAAVPRGQIFWEAYKSSTAGFRGTCTAHHAMVQLVMVVRILCLRPIYRIFASVWGIWFPGNLTIIRWVLSERPKSATSSLGELGFYSSSIGASVIRGPWRDWEALADWETTHHGQIRST